MEIRNIESMSDDDPLRPTIERAKTQANGLRKALEYNLITVQMVVDDHDAVKVAVVAHNPCNLKQYQVIAFLPTLDDMLESLEMNEYAGGEIAKLEDDGMPPELEEAITDLCVKRFALASSQDAEAFIRLNRAPSLEAARNIYQEMYSLTEGGDFNHPLQ